MTLKHPPATQLNGLKLPSGWKVVKCINRNEGATGGNFSCSYIVEKDGEKGFLKAFDFSHAFLSENVIDQLKNLTTSYAFERDILLHCKDARLRKVVVALDHGQVQVPNFDPPNGLVFY
jgi:hypothetical protein